MLPVDPNALSETLYLEEHAPANDTLLAALVEETYRRTLHPRMLGGPILGALLQLLIRLLHATRVLEVGTFTGYSTIQMARAHGGVHVTSLERDELHAAIARRYVVAAGLDPRVDVHLGDALEMVPRLAEGFDLIFLDSDKRDYPTLYPQLVGLLRGGGMLVADNVLWDGKVYAPAARDAHSQALRAFNDMVHADAGMLSCIYPVRDGLLLAQKVE